MDLSQHLKNLTLNGEKSDDLKQESLKCWINCCEKLQPNSKLKKITNIYESTVRVYSTVLLKVNPWEQLHYYKIQILKHKTENKFWLFRTWGTIITPHGDDLLRELPRKVCINKYRWLVKSRLKRDFVTLDIEGSNLNFKDNFESKLIPSIQQLIQLIFNTENIRKVMQDFNLDTNRLRPGQLSNKRIRQAYGKLKMILQAISIVNDKDDEKVVIINEASAKFYSCIPHLPGKIKLLNDKKILQEKLDMLDELSEINLADKIMNYRTGELCNVLDIYYSRLKADIKELSVNAKEFEIIEKYIENTHSFVHNKYEIEVKKIFVINRAGEAQRFNNRTRGIGNRMLLWHGTKVTNISSILLKGLRVPKKSASSTSHMLGRGIYFADVVSKSANYCRVKGQNSTALLMLCEVALGNMEEKYEPDNNLVLPKKKHSAFARGQYGPTCHECTEISPGVKVPYGKLVEQKLSEKSKLKLIHNEYVVYDPAQIKIKYLVQIKFNNAPRQAVI
ncbi:poly [ADP-ribose] polymerase 1-like [Cotesia glomerata]|uniref:poly [ADP-ribose] polymerase 1-like n=1 Tax=Cotesia glomerata TaxID=32391 RepID=UPI001D00F77D|nr:poly [ADP-ribose] polymerase 1-like [Cotesia glomerata]